RFEDGRHGRDLLVGPDPGDADAGGVAALGGDLAGFHADDVAGGGEDQDLVLGADHEGGDHGSPGGGDLDPPHTLPAPALPVEPVELRPLAVAGLGDEEDLDVVAGDVAADHHVVAVLQLHAPHAGRGPAHRPDVVLREADRHP